MIVNITTLKNHLENHKIVGNDAIAIMAVIRKQLEKDKRKGDFEWLKHFCDWCLHPKLEWSIVSVDIINSFTRAFLQVKKIEVFENKFLDFELRFEDNRESIENYFDLIINNFRNELTEFLNIKHINTEFIKTDENFIHFFARVFYIVKNSPLHVPNSINNKKNSQQKKEYDELSTSFYKRWIWSKGVYISTELYPIGINIFHNLDGSFSLSVEMKNGQSFTFKPITYHGGIFLMQPKLLTNIFIVAMHCSIKESLKKLQQLFNNQSISGQHQRLVAI